MQDVIQEFTIGFFDSSGVFSIYMKQDDTDRVIKFHIMDNAEDYREFLSDPHLIITVREQLPSGDMLPDIPIDKQDLDLETMSLTIHVTKAMLQQSGIANCELMFSSIEDGLIITTVPFKLIIEESFMTIPNDSTQIEFDNWTELYIALRSMQDQVESGETFRVENENDRISQENARQAAEAEREHVVGDRVKQAEAWAKGTRDGVPVETSDEAYHNNSRYYSELAENDKNAADVYSEKSEAYAVGKRNGVDVPDTDETYHNNSKYYRDQAAAIMAELDGTIRAQGTCLFEELPDVSDARPGDMWNVSDDFITTDDFREGAGEKHYAGTNVYMTVSNKWDIFEGKTTPDAMPLIALIETSPSTRAYSQGDQFIFDDRLYEAKIDISIGDILSDNVATLADKVWSGFATLDGDNVWTDGTEIYYSVFSDHYKLNKETSTWENKTWNGLTKFYGSNIWTDGDNIYYSYSSNQYVLDKSTSTWSTKTWSGLTSFYGNSAWSDGDNIYYSHDSDQYILDKSTSTWEPKVWNGFTPTDIKMMWNDGADVYLSFGSNNQYVLNKATSTWEPKIWNGFSPVDGENVWTDGVDIYYSRGSIQYVLNKTTSTWEIKIWDGCNDFYGYYIWTDGKHTYYSKNTEQYIITVSNIISAPTIIAQITSGDSKDNTITFTSSDNASTTAKTNAGITSVDTLSGGEKHSSLLAKISGMFLNIRKLWNTIGTTAIPTTVGNTVTDVVKNNLSARYSNKNIPFKFGIDADGNYGYYKDGADTVTPFRTVVNLGTGTSFDLSSYAGYKNFTADNFYIVCTQYNASDYDTGLQTGQYRVGADGVTICDTYAGHSGVSCSGIPTKTYDASTGILTITNTSASKSGTLTARTWSGSVTFASKSVSYTASASINYYVLLIY